MSEKVSQMTAASAVGANDLIMIVQNGVSKQAAVSQLPVPAEVAHAATADNATEATHASTADNATHAVSADTANSVIGAQSADRLGGFKWVNVLASSVTLSPGQFSSVNLPTFPVELGQFRHYRIVAHSPDYYVWAGGTVDAYIQYMPGNDRIQIINRHASLTVTVYYSVDLWSDAV